MDATGGGSPFPGGTRSDVGAGIRQSRIDGGRTRGSSVGVCLFGMLMLAACSVPEHMQVRAGSDPRSQDDDVRFRTLYYFRTFDACVEIGPPKEVIESEKDTGHPFYIKTKGQYRILTDSLYRFRMTGKANPLFSAVHFESGTLRASEIDPFGANVEYDEEGRRFRFVSRKETENRAQRKAIYREMRRLDEMLAGLGNTGGNTGNPANAARQEIANGIKGRINQLWQRLAQLDGLDPAQDLQAVDTINCPKNMVARRGFQILGPEGWRTFNQDERLLLAMSISGKPLISAMKELSSRVLNEQPSASDALLELARERLRIAETKQVLDRLESSTDKGGSPDEIVKNTVSGFSPAETQP